MGALVEERPHKRGRINGMMGRRIVGIRTGTGVSWKEGDAGGRARLLALRLCEEQFSVNAGPGAASQTITSICIPGRSCQNAVTDAIDLAWGPSSYISTKLGVGWGGC